MRANRRKWRRGGCAGLGSRGGHWGIAKTHRQGRDLNRARARAAPRPPAPAQRWVLEAVRGRGGVAEKGYARRREERRARRRGARAHAAANRGPRASPPCRRRRWRPTRPRTHQRGGEGGRRLRPVGKLWQGRSAPVETRPPPLSATCVAVGGRPTPQTRRYASPRRDGGRPRGRGGCDRVRAHARHPHIRRPLARPAWGWTRQRRARSWWQAGPGGRAGGGERAGARGPPLPVRCSAARAATAPPGPPTRQWPGHRRPDCWSAGAERVRQGRVTSATSRTGSPSPAALTLTLTLSLSLSSQHVIAQLLALQQVPHARLDKGRVDGERRAAAQRAVGRAQ